MKPEEWVDRHVRLFHDKGTIVLFTKDPTLFQSPGTIKAVGIFFEGSGDGRVGFAVEANDPKHAEAKIKEILTTVIQQYLEDACTVDYVPVK